ncbi:apical endosomal glycoprotein-like [Pristis pectinata]|uniref:apical endosomal glycoprotein-like n=1 Tax=Pristis pectinata TaxID=685728 RepID=UPI00223D8757|nr:apical endosomal glycoprotein-like [Pristis pectinata]
MQSLHSERFLMCLPILLSLLLLPRSLLAISCNFEIDLCEWENGMVGPQWIQGSWKGPNSTNQGLMYDHTINQRGHYLFVSPAPSGGSKGPARLTSILQTATACDQCFSFWYHMCGPKIGYLSLKVRQQGRREELLWTRTATQGNEWKRGFQTIASQLKHFQLIFEASQTDGGGDIAIDDISVVGGACEPQQMCNFEANSCEFTSTGAQTWRREQGHSGETTNRPAIDITTETGQGDSTKLTRPQCPRR